MNGAALRIQLGHHMLDDSVLARCVDPLQDDEQRPAILGVEPFLEFAETLGVRFDYPLRFSLLEAGRIGRIEFGEPEALGSIDPKALDELRLFHHVLLAERRLSKEYVVTRGSLARG
jgi:hypothetical protein